MHYQTTRATKSNNYLKDPKFIPKTLTILLKEIKFIIKIIHILIRPPPPTTITLPSFIVLFVSEPEPKRLRVRVPSTVAAASPATEAEAATR